MEGAFKKLNIPVQSAKLAPAEFLKEFVDSIQSEGARLESYMDSCMKIWEHWDLKLAWVGLPMFPS